MPEGAVILQQAVVASNVLGVRLLQKQQADIAGWRWGGGEWEQKHPHIRVRMAVVCRV